MNNTKWLVRPEGRIAYDITGEGPLLVCIPGMGDLRQTFRHLVPGLVEAGYRVATMDLRGHGESDTTFTRYDDLAAGQDALALIDELGGNPAVLVGNSMGAGGAAWAAAERPDRVRGLVLLGPFLRDPPAAKLMAVVFRVLLAKPWGPAMLGPYLSTLYAGRAPTDHAAYVSTLRESLRGPGRWRAFQLTTRQVSHAPVEARLAGVHVPALVLMGEKDPDFKDPAAEAAWIRERIGAEVVMVPESGHYPQSQRADVVVPAVKSFLGRMTAFA